MAKYKKLPAIIDAIQFNGDNHKECERFIEGQYDHTLKYPNVKTLGGTVEVSVGDYIVKDFNGVFYPCKPYIFEVTYEEVE